MSFNSEFEKYAVKHRGLSSNTLDSYNKYLVTALTPNIIEERPMNVAVMDVYSRLMMDRIIFPHLYLVHQVCLALVEQA